MAALVHFDVRIAMLDGLEFGVQVARSAATHVPVIEIVGRADKDDWILLGRILGAINIGRHAFAIAHGHHDFALDDGQRFQLAAAHFAFDDSFNFIAVQIRDSFR